MSFDPQPRLASADVPLYGFGSAVLEVTLFRDTNHARDTGIPQPRLTAKCRLLLKIIGLRFRGHSRVRGKPEVIHDEKPGGEMGLDSLQNRRFHNFALLFCQNWLF
jgi:hypothetical protein